MDFSVFKDCTPTNWKQQNAMNNMFKDGWREFDIPRGDRPLCLPIIKAIKMLPRDERFYFKTPLSLGSVLVFENAFLISVEFNYDHLVFHIRFDVENPHITQIAELKRIDSSYSTLTKTEFNQVQPEWYKNYESLRKLDAYIPDFAYAYSYDLSDEMVSTIIDAMTAPEALPFAQHAVSMRSTLHQLRHGATLLTQLPLEALKKYWRLNDQYDDLVNGKQPSPEIIQLREVRYNQNESEYKKQQDRIINLLSVI